MIYEITLPYPPTVNHYYKFAVLKGHNKHSKGAVKVVIGAEGTKYREMVARAIADCGLPKIQGAIALRMYVYTPDKCRRDIDNVCKALYDACTEAGLWKDDSYIVFSQNFKYADPEKQGKVVLKIQQVDAEEAKAGAWLKGE